MGVFYYSGLVEARLYLANSVHALEVAGKLVGFVGLGVVGLPCSSPLPLAVGRLSGGLLAPAGPLGGESLAWSRHGDGLERIHHGGGTLLVRWPVRFVMACAVEYWGKNTVVPGISLALLLLFSIAVYLGSSSCEVGGECRASPECAAPSGVRLTRHSSSIG